MIDIINPTYEAQLVKHTKDECNYIILNVITFGEVLLH